MEDMNSQDKTDRIIELTTKFALGILTGPEKQELEEWISKNPDRKVILENLSDKKFLGENFRKRSLVNPENSRREMEEKLRGGIRRIRISAVVTATMTAAAILLFVFLYPFQEKREETLQQLASNEHPVILNLDSLTPGESVAYVVDGNKRMPLTENNNQTVSMENLREKVGNSKEVILEVPRGGEFIIMLDDSTKVWLNSASTLTYPEDFTNDTRHVSISGEAYFAVAHTKDNKPFSVDCDGQTVRVYGTEFNVRSYPEEEAVYTTLAKGSVSVVRTDHAGGELMLTPGTQSVFNKENKTAATKNVNIETVTGWRHGRFVFENQTLKQIMNDLARWYDFNFEFADPSLEELVFMGSIPRYGDFTTAMLIIEKSGDVAFSTEGEKIVISRKEKK